MNTRKNRKWLGLTALVAVLSLVAGACGSDEEAVDDGLFRIAVVAPSASNDLAFTQSIVDAVHVLDGVDVIDITDGTFIVDDAAAAVRGYAEDGYDLVIAHGSQYGGSLQEIAKDFPDTAFAWGTSSDTRLPLLNASSKAIRERQAMPSLASTARLIASVCCNSSNTFRSGIKPCIARSKF